MKYKMMKYKATKKSKIKNYVVMKKIERGHLIILDTEDVINPYYIAIPRIILEEGEIYNLEFSAGEHRIENKMLVIDGPIKNVKKKKLKVTERKRPKSYFNKKHIQRFASVLGLDVSENIDKIAKAKGMMFKQDEWQRCPCDSNNESRYCVSELCMQDIEKNGICHCRCFKKNIDNK